MDAVKEKIKELFFKNVYGLSPNIEGYDKKHAGAKGHWLEKKLGKTPDASNEADFWGYECKNFTSNKTTCGDWSANEYIFDKNNRFEISRDKFIKLFGKPNKAKKNRCSWSGQPVPESPNKYSLFGQIMSIDESLNISITYSFEKDQRDNKLDLMPKEFHTNNLLLAKWYGYEKNNNSKKSALETKISKKFNQKGWFKCLMKNNTYNEIAFGKTINFESWMNYVQKGDIFFDSGMYQGNNRNYSQWRSVNSFWEELIEERFTKAI